MPNSNTKPFLSTKKSLTRKRRSCKPRKKRQAKLQLSKIQMKLQTRKLTRKTKSGDEHHLPLHLHHLESRTQTQTRKTRKRLASLVSRRKLRRRLKHPKRRKRRKSRLQRLATARLSKRQVVSRSLRGRLGNCVRHRRAACTS